MLSATTKRRLKICGCIFAAAVIGAVVWIAVNVYLFLGRVAEWENIHVYMRCYEQLFERDPELLAKLSETPLEVTGISIRPVHAPWGDPPHLDRWGNLMHFFLVRCNGKIYGKGTSPGSDGKFGTEDDLIVSEYDRTGTIYHIQLIDIDDPETWSPGIEKLR